ncbi:MAG TPA: SCO2523 family variant P-loop protein [Actinocrinis sp.]|nr:SCO2523 family variant P-loop protein [Actinocrinis sp.]
MLIFSVSDKGGTGRSVTSTNVAYQAALIGKDACYLDFDFGSPTVGAIFDVEEYADLVVDDGLHDYLNGRVPEPRKLDVWSLSARDSVKQPPGGGKLDLFPGSRGGSSFMVDDENTRRCVDLITRLNEEYELCIVDLSAGRSFAAQLALQALVHPALSGVQARWLVFHRWTRQHVYAAKSLVHGLHGLIDCAELIGISEERMLAMIRYVRTAVINPHDEANHALRPSQQAWLWECDQDLERLASRSRLGQNWRIGSIPLEPVLQWREQLITDRDVLVTKVANAETIDALRRLTAILLDEKPWTLEDE